MIVHSSTAHLYRYDVILVCTDISENIQGPRQKAITLHVLPLLWHLLEKAAPGTSPAEPGSLRHSTIRLVQTLEHKLGDALFEHARSNSVVTPRMQQILADMTKIEIA